MKPHITRAALLTSLAALAALIAPSATVQAQTLTLKDADTVEAEFRVGEAGKIAVILKFAFGAKPAEEGDNFVGHFPGDDVPGQCRGAFAKKIKQRGFQKPFLRRAILFDVRGRLQHGGVQFFGFWNSVFFDIFSSSSFLCGTISSVW